MFKTTNSKKIQQQKTVLRKPQTWVKTTRQKKTYITKSCDTVSAENKIHFQIFFEEGFEISPSCLWKKETSAKKGARLTILPRLALFSPSIPTYFTSFSTSLRFSISLGSPFLSLYALLFSTAISTHFFLFLSLPVNMFIFFFQTDLKKNRKGNCACIKTGKKAQLQGNDINGERDRDSSAENSEIDNNCSHTVGFLSFPTN